MKDQLKALGLNLLQLAIAPIARQLARMAVALVKASKSKEDDAFLKELAKSIVEQL